MTWIIVQSYINAALSEIFHLGYFGLLHLPVFFVMEHHKEIIKSGCRKILEGINSMSLVNLDDQQVHSLMSNDDERTSAWSC